MGECLYTGSIAADEMPRIVAACHFTREALFLVEHIPQQAVTSPQEGHDLLRFTAFEDDLAAACASYSSGRVFQDDRELRWEKQGAKLRVVYLGPADEDQFAGKLRASEVLATLNKRAEATYYYLFGERLDSSDLQRLSKVAEPGDFAVVRIPRILRYPMDEKSSPYARLVTCEYVDAANHMLLFRFQRLEPCSGGGAR